MSPLDQAREALQDLRERYDWLEHSILNGTPRPYRAPHLTPEQRAEADAAAKAERHERVDIAPGDSPDLYAYDVAELRDLVLVTADAMATEVAETIRSRSIDTKGVPWVISMPTASWGDYGGMWIVFTEHHLEHADRLVAKVLRKAQQLVARADALLGHITDGQLLPGLCPFCGGRTEHAPTGGDRTLRIRTSHRQHLPAEDCGDQCRELVVCEGGMCEPSEAMCGQHHRGNPAWMLASEGEWLAACMVAVDLGQECPICAQPVPETGKRGGQVRYCSDVCRRKANAERMAKTRAAA